MIIIPMAGLSKRFTDAGYTLPKYMLDAHGSSLFSHAVRSFSSYFKTLDFQFICRDVAGTPDFVRSECQLLGIERYSVIVLDGPTDGQAETVTLGLNRGHVARDEAITIFNIDTFRPGFSFPQEYNLQEVDGYLEVFRGSGSNWSYVRPGTERAFQVTETTEKVPISDLCCTGLYHFRSAGQYLDAYQAFRDGQAAAMGLKELYIAPMYNLLLRQGADIRYHLISDTEVIFCGTPDEYREYLAAPPCRS